MKKTQLENHPILGRKNLIGWSIRSTGFVAVLVSSQFAISQDDIALTTKPIVVTPTRIEQSSFDLPMSIDAFNKQAIQGDNLQVNASEVLWRAPGVVANERQNYAQDLQISIRGFGSRATFGVRGIRLLADGIPLTMPDGQGQVGNFDLGSAKQIEVLRGPFSALYGNSSGGVVQIFTEDGPDRPTIEPSAAYGSYDTSRFGLKFGGDAGMVNYLGNATRFDTNGYRDHSAATRDTFNGKLRFDVSEDTKITWLMNYLDQPETQDPGGLNKAAAESSPESVRTQSITFNTRKSISNIQTGAVMDQRLSASDSLRLLGYVGDRQITQYLGFQGAGATSNGGVIDLDRQFGGLDLRWTRMAELGNRPLTFTLGVNYDRMIENRTGFVNNNGIAGVLKRDQDDTVFSFDQYVQAEWQFTDQWSANAGLRHSSVKFKSEDAFLSNGNDSGSADFSDTTPVVGLIYKVTPVLNVYANYGEGFETPTFSELAYRPDGSLGLNFNLKASQSKNYEIGVKALIGDNTRINAAVFQIDTTNEIVVAANVLGRSTYQNAGKTERKGIELGLESKFARGFGGALAYTFLQAEYSENIQTIAISIPAGNKIPGIPENRIYGEVSWTYMPLGFETALEVRYSDKIYVDDANSEFADSYTVGSVRAGFKQNMAGWRFSEFLRVDNITDEKYIGSVIVNDGNGNYYEPAPGINYLLGLSAVYAF